MVIIDTSIWIEFFRNNEPYFSNVSDLLEKNEVLAVSLVFGELLQGAKNKRERTIITEFWNSLPKVTNDDLIIKAGNESSINHWIDKDVGLIDSVLIMASRESSAFLWTLDKKLTKLLRKEEKYSH